MPASLPDPKAPALPGAPGAADDRRTPATPLQALLTTDSDADPGQGHVKIVDTPETRVRHPSDLMAIVLYALGVALVLLAAVYAHSTTEGVAQDVQGFDEILARVLFLPVAVLEGLATIVIPIAVLIELGLRRLGRQIVESISAAALGLALGLAVSWVIQEWGTDTLVTTMSARGEFTMPGYITALAGLLTAAGSRARRRMVAWSWNLLFVIIVITVITGQLPLPSVLVTLLLGRIAGLAVRYVSGVRSERAYGPDLLTAVRRAGFRPRALVRVRDVTDSAELAEAAEDPITEVDADGHITGSVHVGVLRDPASHAETVLTADADLTQQHLAATIGAAAGSRADAVPTPTNGQVSGAGSGARLGSEPGPRSGSEPGPGPTSGTGTASPAPAAPSDPAAIALTRSGDNRVYAMFDGTRRRDVVVLDGDRQVVGFLTRFWRFIRLRGVEGRAAISLRAVAERNALLSYAATAAGVRTPRLLGVGASLDSMVLVTEHADDAVSLRDLRPDQLTDAVLAECWRQLTLAHASGLAHRALTADVVLVSMPPDPAPEPGVTRLAAAPRVWLTGWDQGDIASSTLARRMDVTQMVALLALRVGARRAVDSAARVLPEEHIAAIGPLLQSVTLPGSTREEMRRNKELLKDLRAALLDRLPQADIEPLKLNRFSPRAIITLALTIVAALVIIMTFNFQEIAQAVREANPWWAVASFALGLLTWVGAALTLVAFSPVKLSMWRTILVQAAASFVALAVPAGIGPAALNMRTLTRRNVSTPMAVATVALVQVSQFVMTIVLLLAMSLFSSQGNLIRLPSTTVLIAIAIIAAIVVVVLLVPSIRTWLIGKIRPTVEQVWPRLSQMLSQPGRLVLGLVGNLVVTLGFILAFNAALLAFGQHLSIIDLTVVYLLGNTAGALVPVPGGIGATEASLAVGLRGAGVSNALSLPVAVLFRVTTYWVRIPIGWAAMRYLQRQGEL